MKLINIHTINLYDLWPAIEYTFETPTYSVLNLIFIAKNIFYKVFSFDSISPTLSHTLSFKTSPQTFSIGFKSEDHSSVFNFYLSRHNSPFVAPYTLQLSCWYCRECPPSQSVDKSKFRRSRYTVESMLKLDIHKGSLAVMAAHTKTLF
jgi:hypothetical protein